MDCSPTSFLPWKSGFASAPLHHTTLTSPIAFRSFPSWTLHPSNGFSAPPLYHSRSIRWHKIKWNKRKRTASIFYINTTQCYNSINLMWALSVKPMRRENNHQTASQSSIALLQERFRQLQTVKEMREEREQERAWSRAKRSNIDAQCAQPMWFNHPELPPPSMPLRGPPSCWPGNRGGHTADLQDLKTSLPMNLWPNQSTSQLPATCTKQEDVDTTLHL